MNVLLKILPELGSGRGTARRVVEGSALQAPLARPTPPSALRAATSPRQARGGSKKDYPTTPVTLNSFQGPSLPARRSAVGQRGRAVAPSTQATGRAARWMLKQVQHDDVVREGAE